MRWRPRRIASYSVGPGESMSFDEPVRPDGAFTIGFIAALARECTSLRRQVPRSGRWHVVQSGPGAVRAAAAASRAIDGGACLLSSWGLAGGLTAAVAPGTVVLPWRVLADGETPLPVDAVCHSRLAALADELAVDYGDLLTVAEPLESPAAKRAAAAASAAVAVDMESAGIAIAAARARVPLDRKSTRLNSSHSQISYAVFCLKKKKNKKL